MTAKFRNHLPQMNGNLFLTDGGIETTLIFHEGFDLPLFAAFDLFKNEEGRAALRNYFTTYAQIARDNQVGFVLESATWRASDDWGAQLGYSPAEIKHINRQAIEMLFDVRADYETADSPMVISGCIGPRGDGYNPARMMTAEEAQTYHMAQAQAFQEAGVDMISAITINYMEEAIGITRAAQALNMPVVISFTVETDGKLPTGHTLKEAIQAVDAATNDGPAYYMINCAHPTHFDDILASGEEWVYRIRALRANASRMSHAELDESEHLDEGDPVELGQQYQQLRERLPHINVLGGCCGTDHRHITEICKTARIPA